MDSIGLVDPELVEKAALVALLRQPKARWAEITADVLEHGTAVGVLEARLNGDDTLFAVDDLEQVIETAAQDIRSWQQDGIGVHAFYEQSYPAQLRDVHELPPVLFTRGELVDDRRAVAVVGTRQASERGLEIARRVATALVKNEVAVVSGLAAGIDTAAHVAALAAKGRTVAVLGTGIRQSYPASNAELQRRICSEGLVVSQFWPDAAPSQKTFPMRNAVMSGYASATVVIEAAWRSGARIQARLALQHGRPVVMPQELMEHDWARDFATRPGVYVVADLGEMLTVIDRLVTEATSGLDKLQELSDLVRF